MNNSISDAELVLLQIIWDASSPISSYDIYANLPEDIDWQRTTVSTLLSRLVEKKAITVERRGKNYYYDALINEEEYKKNETKAFVKKIHGNKLSSFVAALSSDEVFTEEEINELKDLISKI